MSKFRKAVLGCAALMLLLGPWAAFAGADSVPSQPHLLVKGYAQRVVKPDRFTIELMLQDTDLQPEAARSRVQANARQVVDALKAKGALPGTVEATTLSVAPAHEYIDGKQVFVGTRVNRIIRGTFGSTGTLRGFLAQLKADEHLQVRSLHTGYAAAGTLRAELKAEAAAQTRRSAEGLARAYGSRIKGLYTISDVAPNFAYGVRAGTWPQASGQDDAVAPPSPPAPPAPLMDVAASVDPSVDPEVLEGGTLTFFENVYAIFLIE